MTTKRKMPDIESFSRDASVLSQALPYMQRYEGKTVVVKYGGHAMGDVELGPGVGSERLQRKGDLRCRRAALLPARLGLFDLADLNLDDVARFERISDGNATIVSDLGARNEPLDTSDVHECAEVTHAGDGSAKNRTRHDVREPLIEGDHEPLVFGAYLRESHCSNSV